MLRILRFALPYAVVLSALPAVCAAQVSISGAASFNVYDSVTFQNLSQDQFDSVAAFRALYDLRAALTWMGNFPPAAFLPI